MRRYEVSSGAEPSTNESVPGIPYLSLSTCQTHVGKTNIDFRWRLITRNIINHVANHHHTLKNTMSLHQVSNQTNQTNEKI
jgi:hypothetical protein